MPLNNNHLNNFITDHFGLKWKDVCDEKLKDKMKSQAQALQHSILKELSEYCMTIVSKNW